jgi:hypothetical protein
LPALPMSALAELSATTAAAHPFKGDGLASVEALLGARTRVLSDLVVEALKARGVEVQYLVKDNEGHGFRNEENRFEFYEAMDKFLDQHIGKNP